MDKTTVFDLLPPIFRESAATYAYPRHDLRYPFVVDGWVYATDGRFLVRKATTPEITAAIPDISPKTYPAAAGKQFKHRWESAPTNIPALSDLPRCKKCEGKGTLPERSCSCEAMWDHEETPCRGLGRIPAGECWDCEGTEIHDPREHGIAFRQDVEISAYFLHRLKRHGAVLFLPVERVGETGPPIYFALPDDAEGVVMPLDVKLREKRDRERAARQAV